MIFSVAAGIFKGKKLDFLKQHQRQKIYKNDKIDPWQSGDLNCKALYKLFVLAQARLKLSSILLRTG